MLRMPPLTRTDTIIVLEGDVAKLVRMRDGLMLLTVPRASIHESRIGLLGYANPHAALYDAYAAEFDKQFLSQLMRGVVQ